MAIVTFCSRDVIGSELPLRSIDIPYIWLVMDDELPAQGNALMVKANCISLAAVAPDGTEKRTPFGILDSPKKMDGDMSIVPPTAGAVSFWAAALIELPLADSMMGAWPASWLPRAYATSECTESSVNFETEASSVLLRVADEIVA
jgi:hypothetical protein